MANSHHQQSDVAWSSVFVYLVIPACETCVASCGVFRLCWFPYLRGGDASCSHIWEGEAIRELVGGWQLGMRGGCVWVVWPGGVTGGIREGLWEEGVLGSPTQPHSCMRGSSNTQTRPLYTRYKPSAPHPLVGRPSIFQSENAGCFNNQLVVSITVLES